MKSTLPPYLDGSVLRDLAIQTGSQVRSVRYASEVLGVAPEDIYTASQSWGRRQFDKQRRRALPRTFEPAAYQDVEAIVVEAARFIYTHSVLNGLTKCDALSQLSTSVLGFFMAITLEDTPFEQQVDPSQYNTIGSGAVCYHFREEKQGITAAASLDELTATLALRKYIYESTNGGNGFMPNIEEARAHWDTHHPFSRMDLLRGTKLPNEAAPDLAILVGMIDYAAMLHTQKRSDDGDIGRLVFGRHRGNEGFYEKVLSALFYQLHNLRLDRPVISADNTVEFEVPGHIVVGSEALFHFYKEVLKLTPNGERLSYHRLEELGGHLPKKFSGGEHAFLPYYLMGYFCLQPSFDHSFRMRRANPGFIQDMHDALLTIGLDESQVSTGDNYVLISATGITALREMKVRVPGYLGTHQGLFLNPKHRGQPQIVSKEQRIMALWDLIKGGIDTSAALSKAMDTLTKRYIYSLLHEMVDAGAIVWQSRGKISLLEQTEE